MAGSPRGTHTYLHDGWRFLVATGCMLLFRRGGGKMEGGEGRGEGGSHFLLGERVLFFFEPAPFG